MTYAYLFLTVLLLSLMWLDGDGEPCPVPCHCTLKMVNCSRSTSSHGLHHVPLPEPAVPRHPFEYLDFTGNAISSMGKEVWQSYPWAEYLVLKGNHLSRLQNSSLEGLLSLTYLDLSCNKIQVIERNAFEAVPFLQFINLSGNVIEQIVYGTFRAWHGMQFLLKVDLSHNPLAVIQDSYFYRLPSLKLLDLGATEITPMVLEDLLQTSLQLRTLILPKKMSCCLCHIKDDIEVLCETVKLKCTESCAVKAPLCGNEESLNRLQEELMKALETRKLNGSSLLSIMPERATSNESLTQNYSSLAASFNLLKAIMLQADESLDVDMADKGELKNLYMLVSLLRAALKEKFLELIKHQDSEKSSEDSVATAYRKERQVRNVRRERWLRTNLRNKATFFRLGRDGRESPQLATPSSDQTGISDLNSEAERWRKLGEDVDPQRDISHLRSLQGVLHTSWKRSIKDSPLSGLKLRASIKVNNNDLLSLSKDRNSVAVLRNGLGAHTLTEEELLQWLLHRHEHPEGEGTPKISAVDSDSSLREISPDITLPDATYWEHHRTSASPPPNLASPDDYLLQGDLFEAELNKQLTPLIPNVPVRKLISLVIRILKMDCTEPMMEGACTKLIARTGLLMKLFSERENVNETSSAWKSYFWPSKNIANLTTASSRKLEKPLPSQEAPEYMHENKLLLGILVTGIVMIIIGVICMIEICSRRSAAREGSQKRTFLGRRKKSLSDEEATDSFLMDKPLWLKDMYEPLSEIRKKNMVDKLDDEVSSEEMISWGSARPSLLETPVKKLSSRMLSTPQPAPASTPSPPPSQKSSVKQGSGTPKGASEAASSKEASLAADKDEEDEGGSAEQFAEAASEAASEAAESGEGEGGGEEEEDEEEDDE